jgi:hypothetical protein
LLPFFSSFLHFCRFSSRSNLDVFFKSDLLVPSSFETVFFS